MINVDQITARLAKMPDQALQQYASMHKDDPYIMALAVSESNRRKQLREAAHAAQAGQEPPKVVDEELAMMAEPESAALPEEQGIARLPAGNMDFAGGGIVAFAGDGPSLVQDEEARNPLAFLNPGDFFSGVGRIFREGIDPVAAEKRRREAEYARQQKLHNLRTPPEETVGTPEFAAAQESLKRQAAAEGRTLPSEETVTKAPPTADSRAPALPAMPSMNVEQMASRALDEAAKKPNPFAADFEKLTKERVAAREEEVKGLEAIQKQFSDIYKGRKDRLDTREGELGKLKNEQTGLALLQAGATIMSTPGGLGTAIGKGVQVGTEKYAAGLEKLQAAKEKISDARDKLEEIEAQRNELSAKELFKARNEVRNEASRGHEELIKANMQMYGVNRDTAMKIVDGQIKIGVAQIDAASRERVAGIQARATEGRQQQQLAQLAQRTLNDIRTAAQKAFPYDPSKRETFVQQELNKALQYNPDLAQYVYGAAGSGGAPAAGAATHRFNPATGQIEPVR